MERPANVVGLTKRENECLEHLLAAQDLFDEICAEFPQSSADTYNFGHYLEAARTSIYMRGFRRLDPKNLLKTPLSAEESKLSATLIEHARSVTKDYGVEGQDWSNNNAATS